MYSGSRPFNSYGEKDENLMDLLKALISRIIINFIIIIIIILYCIQVILILLHTYTI